MTRSQWICNSCGTGFGTKGRRDYHYRKEHLKRSVNSYSAVLNDRVKDSNDSILACTCGKRYQHALSLKRHRKGCTEWILMEQLENARENSPEGNTSTL